MQMLAALLLVLSGIAALTYQLVWVRLLGLSMGSTSASVATVLAVFFLGLAIGSYLAERITRNRIDNLNSYIVLELCIGVAGIILLPVLVHLDHIMAAIPQWGSYLPFKFLVTVILLLIPTICMGATFPVMAAVLVRQQRDMGLRVSLLYSLNTLGAVLGAMLSGFALIPFWGLDGAIYVAAGINAVIVVIALYANKRLELTPMESGDSFHDILKPQLKMSEHTKLAAQPLAMLVLFTTGFTAIAMEIGWTKYLSIFTGTTIYGFAAILTVFLFGIAAGSWWMRKYLDYLARPEFSLAIGLLILGVTLLFTRALLSTLPPIFEAVNHFAVTVPVRHLMKYFIVFIMLFAPTFVFGALFPLNLKMYCGNLLGIRTRIGKAYAINTIASIFGAVAAGFWIIPMYGTDVLLTSCAVIILILPLLFLKSIVKPIPRFALVMLTVIAISSNWLFSHISYQELIASVQYQYDNYADSNKKPSVLYVKEGKTGVISLVTYDGRYVRLQNNGLNESSFDKQQPDKPPVIEYLLGLMPYFLHDNPKTAFVVGYGGGFTTKALSQTAQLTQIKVVELEPAIIAADKFLLSDAIPALQDPRLSLEYNDARNTLLMDNTRYDLIAAQPSHPWLSRASTVFTQEFFSLVKSRLNPGGVYGQWLSLFNMDATTMKSIMRSFYNVFPHGFTMADISTGDLLMFGSDHPLQFEPDRIRPRFYEDKIKQALAFYNLQRPEDLLWYFSLSRTQVMEEVEHSKPNTDLNIMSEIRLSALDQNATGRENPYTLLKDRYTLDAGQLLGNNAASIFYSYAQSLLEWREYDLVHFVIENLQKLDPLLASAVEFAYSLRIYDYDSAIAIYDDNGSWPAAIHQQYAGLMMQLQRFGAAKGAINRVQDEPTRRSEWAKLLYKQGQFKRLANIKPHSDTEQMWQLSGQAKLDLARAGKALQALADKNIFTETQVRLMIQYASQINDDAAMNRYTRRLTTLLNNQANDIKRALNIAIKNKSVSRAHSLLTQIEALHPDVEDLASLRDKVMALEKDSSSSQVTKLLSRRDSGLPGQ